MSPTPKVAPFESCVSCLKGDTTTAFAVKGSAEAAIAALHLKGGLSVEDAEATVLAYAEHELGCDPGKVPGGDEHVFVFRLCRECAEQTRVSVGELPEVPVFRLGDGPS